MREEALTKAVESFAAATVVFVDTDLARPWAWRMYDEGVRHAFFRTYEELRELASRLGTMRLAQGRPRTTAQHALGQYHAAYRDLQAILLAVSDEQAAQPPAEGEWPLWKVVSHILQAERAFYALTLYAVERLHGGEEKPVEMTEEDWAAFWAGDPFKQIVAGEKLAEILGYSSELHARILRDLAAATDEELQAPSLWWEEAPMTAEFRLHRLDSHRRQHTIQAEKTLHALGLYPTEAMRLLRLIFNALAEVEGMRIGADGIGEEECRALAEGIEKRGEEVAAAISS